MDNNADNGFSGRLVERRQDETGVIEVIDSGHQRTMSFDQGLIQSRKDLFKPNSLIHEYTRAMLIGLTFNEVKHATILGLGGACLVRAIHALSQTIHTSAVELRESVAELAKAHFGLPKGPEFELTITDALSYLKHHPPQSTDIILSDLYNAHDEDQIQTDKRFLQACYRALSDDGWLIINYHRFPESGSEFHQNLSTLFSEIYLCKTSEDNHILYAGKTAPTFNRTTRLEIMERYQGETGSRLGLLYKQIIRLQDQFPVSEL